MSLFEKIIALYPDLKPEDFDHRGGIVLQNDGQGDYIKEWNHPTLKKPTNKQLA